MIADDKTEIDGFANGVTWGHMREKAMASGYKESAWYKKLSTKGRWAIKFFRRMQEAQGDMEPLVHDPTKFSGEVKQAVDDLPNVDYDCKMFEEGFAPYTNEDYMETKRITLKDPKVKDIKKEIT